VNLTRSGVVWGSQSLDVRRRHRVLLNRRIETPVTISMMRSPSPLTSKAPLTLFEVHISESRLLKMPKAAIQPQWRNQKFAREGDHCVVF